MNTRIENGWAIDERNNRASVQHWGSEEKALRILQTLDNCSDCSDCSNCSDCSDCSNCSNCSDCSDCSDCYRCSRCSDCSNCSRCSDCYDCSDMAPQKCQMEIPAIPDIHRKVWDAVSRENALDMNTWHHDAEVKDGAYCGTTHCRAGWVIALAGKAGRDLEQTTSEVFAASQIYKASGYTISPCRFFDSNEEALADMRKLAMENN